MIHTFNTSVYTYIRMTHDAYIHTYMQTYDTYVRGGCDIQYLYNIYKRQVFKPFSKYFFLKKKFKVICILNLKNTLFKGVYKGGPLCALSREAKFTQDAKI